MRSTIQCLTVLGAAAAMLLAALRPTLACVGDCDGNGQVTIDELIRAVQVSLGEAEVASCDAADNNRDGAVTVNELIRSVGKGLGGCGGGPADQVLFSPQNNELDEYDLGDGTAATGIASTHAHVNGQACLLPGGGGQYVLGEDTGQPAVRPGWAIFSPDGTFLKKLPLPARENETAVGDPIGCALDADGRLFGTAIGSQGGADGQLVVFFPPDYGTGCVLDQTLRTPGTMTTDEQGNVYVAESTPPGKVVRFAPPFPASADECAGAALNKSDFITYSDAVASLGVARDAGGHFFVSQVVGLGGAGAGVREHAADGTFIRELFPPGSGGNPAGLAVDAQGSVYYADIGLDAQNHTVPGKGTVRKISFDAQGRPAEPELIARGLTFPDAVTVMPKREEWLTLGGGLRRTYFNPREHTINRHTAPTLIPKWRYLTSGMISAQPVVVTLDLPDEGPTPVVIFPSWDRHVYALRVSNGSRVWSFEMDPQPGTFYPYSGGATIAWQDGQPRVYVPGGETLYCLDAIHGVELWRFVAGTGCTTCTSHQERNEIESTPAVVNGLVIVGMDTNDGAPGRGGIMALSAADGHLVWWFDVFSRTACRPFPGDDVHQFDGFNSAAALGLPEDFFATRPGCDFDRTSNGCGNVWSSAAVDARRGLLYTVSSNCDTDTNPDTPDPPPPPPPLEEAIFALTLDGDVAWSWRPREVDPDDLDFGAVPNLFEAEIGGQTRDLVGVGGKDGTYYVLDRDGTNAITGTIEPYWQTNVVPGGPAGGIIGAASVGEGRIVFSTAPGFSVFSPQKPSAHALDPSTGAIVWENSDVDISFGPVMGVPGLALTGSTPRPNVNIFDRADGTLLKALLGSQVPSGIAAGVTPVGGMLFVGGGTGAFNSGADANAEAVRDTPLTAFCVPGTPGCVTNTCNDGNPCTYDYPDATGTCVSEVGPAVDCRVGTAPGVCQGDVCVVTETAPTPTPGEG
jgi:outer membrane protein assembly factor BamB